MGKISAPDQSNTALSYYLQICANLSSNHTCTEQYPGIGCAQQWTDGQCDLWLAEWDISEAQIMAANYSDPSMGLTIELANGEKCRTSFGVIYPYKARFIFLCDKTTNLTVRPGYVNPADVCMYEFTLLSKYACGVNNTATTTPIPSGECIWMSSDGNHMLNISSIIGQTLSISEGNTSYLYYLYTPCTNTLKCDNNTYAMAYIFDGYRFECKKYLAVWEDGINGPNYSEELKTWQFVFTNGERCDNFENVFIIEWVCDEAAVKPSVVKAIETITCNYQLVINSSLACH
eukprot:554782_1